MLVENPKWDTILERIQDDAIPDTAICTDGFWAKVLVTNEKWGIILKRIKDDRLPDRAINAGGFWSKVLIMDKQWITLLMRIQDAAIPDVAMERNGLWSRILVPSSPVATGTPYSSTLSIRGYRLVFLVVLFGLIVQKTRLIFLNLQNVKIK